MNGMIFNIQRFCVNDGPGIRTTVFVKGCPLRCAWCHNAESQSRKQELSFDVGKCVACGACVRVCEQRCHSLQEGEHRFHREGCVVCGACPDVCAPGALELIGTVMSVDEVVREVLKDKTFYQNSSGGMTISGGEPLMQPAFTYELLKSVKEHGIHTCMETCGFSKKDDILNMVPYTDIFLFDWKLTNDELHQRYTGVSNKSIVENLKAIDAAGSTIILRCPIIPTINDTDEHFAGIANLANSLKNIRAIELEPYHSLGNTKYQKLGKTDALPAIEPPSDQQINEWLAAIQRLTAVTVKKA